MESFLFQSGIVSASLQVILDRFTSFAERELGNLMGVDDELKKLERTLLKVQTLTDTLKNQHECSCNHAALKLWLRDLQNMLHDVDDFLDEIALELTKLSSNKLGSKLIHPEQVRSLVFSFSFPSQVVNMQRKLDNTVKEMDSMLINEVLLKVTQPNFFNWKLQSSSLVDESSVVGRQNDKTEVVRMLLSGESERESFISVIAIVGMAGVGKTTLAQLVYNDREVVENFQRIWVSISADHSIERITKSILDSCSANGETLKLSDLDPIQISLQKVLYGRKVLIVLDNMWNENASHWDALRLPFKVTARGSKVLVTTQSMIVSNIVATGPTYHVHPLSDEHCWALIKQRAFLADLTERNNGVEIGQRMAEKCKGLPLAARALGSALCLKSHRREWEAVLDSKIWELSEIGNELIHALKSSYDLLPQCVKYCFAYCSIFPQNFEFIKDDLAQLWVAEGFIQPKPVRRVLDIGKEYFDILLLRSFFQLSHLERDNQSMYKMHHLIHELAEFVSGELCLRMDDENIIMSLPRTNLKNARYVSFLCNGNNFTWPLHLFHKCCRLRTFILLPSESGIHVDHQIPCDLFLSLRRMRVLNLSYTNIIELPDSIGTLKHLRYLNVSSTHIEKLPESVTNLYGLETLKLKNCFNLLQLPKYMRNLSNLRHLELDIKHQLSSMPLEFGKLTNLQTLSAFIVGKEPGQRIEELNNMNFLHGSICITNLENVVNVNEAEFANLDKKLFLDKLELQWNEVNVASAQQVLAKLRPHYKIKELTISSYGGVMFPGWLSDASFDKLESIYLQNCRYCKYLPELDQLPSLRWLYIHEMHDLRVLEVSSGFPSLQSLKLHDMVKLQGILLLPSAMLNLRELTIVDCPNLRYLTQLHHLSQLEYLEISRCPQLQFSPTEELPSSLKSLIIIECDTLKQQCRENFDRIRTIERVEIDYELVQN